MTKSMTLSTVALFVAAVNNINPTVIGSASLLEIVWTVTNLWGCYRSASNYHDAHQQMRAALTEPVDTLAVDLARIDVVVQRAMLLYQFAGVVAGVIAMFVPPATANATGSVAEDVLIILLLIIGRSVLMTGVSEYIARSRKRIVAQLAIEGQRKHGAQAQIEGRQSR